VSLPLADLGALMPPETLLAGLSAQGVEEVRELQRNLQRRLVDQRLRDELAAQNFTGGRYQRFQTELARYGIAVLCGWMHTGIVFKFTAARGMVLHPNDTELEELRRDPDAREDLATMTVAYALPRFREQALICGGWRHDGGASLTTYFVGACLYIFPNQFRHWRMERERWRRQDRSEWSHGTDRPHDPADLAGSNLRTREYLDRLDPRTRSIVELVMNGYTQHEIVELLEHETSARAIEGVLHRWRNAKAHLECLEGRQW
jgi:hypothetical protein